MLRWPWHCSKGVQAVLNYVAFMINTLQPSVDVISYREYCVRFILQCILHSTVSQLNRKLWRHVFADVLTALRH